MRQALGATPRDILRLVFSSGAGMTLVGLVVGVALALGSTRAARVVALRRDCRSIPATFVGVAAVLMAAAAGAIYLPARRATRISPAIALRGD